MILSSNYYLVGAKKVILIVASFFAPYQWLMLALILLTVQDTRMGRKAAKHQALKDGKEPRLVVTSHITRKGLSEKMITFSLIFLSSYAVDRAGMSEWVSSVSVYLFDYLHNISFVFDSFKSFFSEYFLSKCSIIVMIAMEVDSIHEKDYILKGIPFEKRAFKAFSRLWPIVRRIRGIISSVIEVLKGSSKDKTNKQ